MKRLVALASLLVSTHCSAADGGFEGLWETTFGPMELRQKGDQVTGSYSMRGASCPLQGRVSKGRFEFTYREGDTTGEGWFQLGAGGGTFAGKWRPTGSEDWQEWRGKRKERETGFGGLWSSSYGRLRLVREGDGIEGIYSGEGGSTIKGQVKDGRFEFRYQEPSARGEGWFELAAAGASLSGKWRPDGRKDWKDWNASRVSAEPGVTYLVVMEARWEEDLGQQEYAFGDMLKAFFERTPNVQVRRRALSNASDLQRWCREVSLLAEPVVVCLSSHGNTEGLQVAGRTIKPEVIADSLRSAGNVKLLHFSSCLIMKNQLAERLMKRLGDQATYPISGYTTSVDWAASAVIEFMYFDLVLVRRMSPEKAARQIRTLFPIAGSQPVPGAVLSPAGFRILVPPLPGANSKTPAGKKDPATSPAQVLRK